MALFSEMELGEQYEVLTLLLSQLNDDAPKIQVMYKELKENADAQNRSILEATKKLTDLRTEAEKSIGLKRDSAQKTIEEYQAIAEQTLSDAQKLQSQVNSFASFVSSTDSLLQRITQRLDQMDMKLKTIEQRVNESGESINIPIPQGGKETKTAKKKDVQIDYNEVTTAQDLYEKYYGKIDGPLIVQRKSWYNDYALVINSLTYVSGKPWVKGDIYKDGILDRSTSYHADTVEFKMYRGPSAEKIKADLELPF